MSIAAGVPIRKAQELRLSAGTWSRLALKICALRSKGGQSRREPRERGDGSRSAARCGSRVPGVRGGCVGILDRHRKYCKVQQSQKQCISVYNLW